MGIYVLLTEHREIVTMIVRTNSMNISKTYQRGQILLMIILVMIVALTVTLSVATRSITNLRTTTEEETSQRAFSAAEAGIEQALKSTSTGTIIGVGSTNPNGVPFSNDAKITEVKINSISPALNTAFLLSSDLNSTNVKKLSKDNGIDLWFVPHDGSGKPDFSQTWPDWTDPTPGIPYDGTVAFYWGEDGNTPCNNAAFEILFLKKNGSSVETVNKVYDPCDTRGNYFVTPLTGGIEFGKLASAITIGTKSFYYKVTLVSIPLVYHAKVIPLYYDSFIGVQSDKPLPEQGRVVESTATAGDTTRKVSFFSAFGQIPVEMFSVQFSP